MDWLLFDRDLRLERVTTTTSIRERFDQFSQINPANKYLLKVTIKTLEKYVKYVQNKQQRRKNDIVVNFEHISRLFLVFLLLI